jgi:hypothetical protein
LRLLQVARPCFLLRQRMMLHSLRAERSMHACRVGHLVAPACAGSCMSNLYRCASIHGQLSTTVMTVHTACCECAVVILVDSAASTVPPGLSPSMSTHRVMSCTMSSIYFNSVIGFPALLLE